MYKQVIIVRKDLKLGKGKLAAHVAHAAVEAVFLANERIVKKWRMLGGEKVVLKVKNLQTLKKIYERVKSRNIPCVLIRDMGKTQLKPGTITAVGIGPVEEEKIDEITGKLKLL